MSSKYDPEILQSVADKLYSRANLILLGFSILGFLIGLVAASAFEERIYNWLAPLGLIAGLALGQGRALQLKAEAQRILCLMQIEKNTRRLVL